MIGFLINQQEPELLRKMGAALVVHPAEGFVWDGLMASAAFGPCGLGSLDAIQVNDLWKHGSVRACRAELHFVLLEWTSAAREHKLIFRISSS